MMRLLCFLPALIFMAVGCAEPTAAPAQLDVRVRMSQVHLEIDNPTDTPWPAVLVRVDNSYHCPSYKITAGQSVKIPLSECVTRGGERFEPARRRARQVSVRTTLDGVEHFAGFEP